MAEERLTKSVYALSNMTRWWPIFRPQSGPSAVFVTCASAAFGPRLPNRSGEVARCSVGVATDHDVVLTKPGERLG